MTANAKIRTFVVILISVGTIVGVVFIFNTYFLAANRQAISISREQDGQLVMGVCSDFDATKVYVSQRMTGGDWTEIWIANGHSPLAVGSTLRFGEPPNGMINEMDRELVADHGEFSIQVLGNDKSVLAYFPWHDYSKLRPGLWYYTDGLTGDGPCEPAPR